jgi:hypothetical protein
MTPRFGLKVVGASDSRWVGPAEKEVVVEENPNDGAIGGVGGGAAVLPVGRLLLAVTKVATAVLPVGELLSAVMKVSSS